MDNLDRILPLLRCPECHADPLTVERGVETVVKCAACRRAFAYRDRILHLLAERDAPVAQRAFGKWSALSYDVFAARGAARRFYRWRFEDEVREYTRPLDLQADDMVVDAGCGTGNYTLALARMATRGYAIGVDISIAMLTLLKQHADREGLTNVVLLLASVENLPFRTASIPKLFNGCLHHLFPRLAPTLSEAQRCLTAGGRLVGSAFFKANNPLLKTGQRPAALALAARPVNPEMLARGLQDAGLAQVEVDAGNWKRFFFGLFCAVKLGAVPTSLKTNGIT